MRQIAPTAYRERKHPLPLENSIASHDGFRSVRLVAVGGHMGPVTADNPFRLAGSEKVHLARRAAAMWNHHLGQSTAEIEAFVEQRFGAIEGAVNGERGAIN
jgi:hypothetical protein